MTSSIWPSSSDASTEPLRGDLEAPIVVVGAGISGITTAYELAKKGHRPVLIDSGKPAAGETHYTSAHLSSVLDSRYTEIERLHGEQGAKWVYQSHAAAIDWIEKTAEDLSIECEFQRLDGYLFDTGTKGLEFLQKELLASRNVGHTEAELLGSTPLPGLEDYPCIRYPHQARFNPGLYINGLLKELKRLEVPIYRDARILSWEGKEKIVLKTDNEFAIQCEKVVFACNDPFVRFKYYTLHAPYRTYVSAFAVPDEIKADGLYWDTEDPYHYLRFASDPDGKGRVLLVGGEDHKTGQNEHADTSWDRLAVWSKRLLPWLGSSVAHWSGQVLETVDGLAFVGQDPDAEGKILMISCDCGSGLTHGTLGALLTSNLIEGKSLPWQEIYDPGRFRWKAFPEFIKENANVARQYLNVVLPAGSKEENVTEEHGEVVQDGIGKSACVADGAERKELTAICTHLGGLVTWNEAEGTWDCQCHGSRFTASGEVISGPAVTPLKLKNKEPVK